MQLSLLIIILLIIVEYINTDQGCIRDDRFCINEGKTQSNQKCIKWSLSKFHEIIKIFENTTLCRWGHHMYWCPTNEFYYERFERNFFWDYCTPIYRSCEISNNICENMINWEIFDKSINLNISNKLNIVIILNKSHSQCAIYIRCYQCDQIKEIIEIFSGCQLLNNYQNNNDLIIFNNLNQNTQYIFYILPIKQGKLEGSVFNLSLTTVPDVPVNIIITNETSTTMTIHWDSIQTNNTFDKKQLIVYEITMKRSSTEEKYNTTNHVYTFKELSTWEDNCFTISAINFVGKSKQSNKLCKTQSAQRLIFFVLYLFIIMFLLLIVSYVIYNKDLLLLKRKKTTVKKSMLLTESSPVRTEIKTSLIKNGDIQLKEISNSNEKSKNSKCDLPIENKKLSKEFKEINIKSQNIEILHKLTTDTGRSIENKSKNRFINILPFDQTRIILNSSPSKNDYINANYIPFLQDINKHEYIASQGPINDTINDFWQMIWENNVSLIIMLTRTYEEEKFKCLQYWPEHIDQKIEYGENKEFQVRIAEEINRNSFVERKLQIFDKISNENRFIIHLHMLEWFDYSAPNLSEFESLIFRFQEIVLAKEIHPYLIHCSAGVGRTGTFIVLDRIIRKLMNGNMNIDICAEILELRKYRKMMVQRAAQYIFIHEFVQYFIGKYIKNNNNTNQEDNIYFNS